MKKKLTLIALIITMLILPTTLVQANYQSIKTGYGDTPREEADTWITGIRQMESTGQVMGLNETIGEDAMATTDSNNIDVHMLKNTEYGAIILLGASNYGKQGTGKNRYMNEGETTITGTDVKASSTGNVSGIYELGYTADSLSLYRIDAYEWVAGGRSEFLPNIAKRYIDRYTDDETSVKVGDATIEGDIILGQWHTGSKGNWSLFKSTEGFYRAGYYSESTRKDYRLFLI